MTVAYVTVTRHSDGETIGNHEFSGETWMDAADAAWAWIREWRREGFSYIVWL